MISAKKGLSSLSNFIKNISNRRKSKMEDNAEESKLDEIDLIDDRGQLIGLGSKAAIATGITDITLATTALRAIGENSEMDGDHVSEFSDHDSSKDGGDEHGDSSSEEWDDGDESESSDEGSDGSEDESEDDESDSDENENESDDAWEEDKSVGGVEGDGDEEVEATSTDKDGTAPECSL